MPGQQRRAWLVADWPCASAVSACCTLNFTMNSCRRCVGTWLCVCAGRVGVGGESMGWTAQRVLSPCCRLRAHLAPAALQHAACKEGNAPWAAASAHTKR